MKEIQSSTYFLAKQHGGRLEVATKPGPFACLRQTRRSVLVALIGFRASARARVRAYRSP